MGPTTADGVGLPTEVWYALSVPQEGDRVRRMHKQCEMVGAGICGCVMIRTR